MKRRRVHRDPLTAGTAVVPTRAIALVLPLLALCAASFAADSRDLIAQGNAHYAAGRYPEALQSYEEAAAGGAGQSLEVLHDQAAAHFRLGQIDEARELWVRAQTLGDAAYEARSRYNLGNCDYADALAAAQGQDAQKALKLLVQAADEYRNALRIASTLTDARANLELTHLLKKQIEEQQKDQPQSQPSSQPCSQPSSQSSQSQPSSQQSQQQQKQDQSSQPTSQPQTQPQEQPAAQQPQQEQQEPASQ
jgi:Ca-activated chloride channel homolog